MTKIKQLFVITLFFASLASAENEKELSALSVVYYELSNAIIVQDLDKVKEIVIHTPEILNYRLPNGTLILHHYFLTPDIARFLLYSGANPDVRDNDGNTPLHITVRKKTDAQNAEQNQITIMELLISNNADIDAVNNDGETPLEMALKYNNYFAADTLIKRGAEYTIHMAAAAGKTVIVSELVKEKPELLHEKDSNGRTPLHCVSAQSKAADVRFLLNNNLGISDKRDIQTDQLETARLLLDKGAYVNRSDNRGWLSLHCAAESGRDDILELIAGIDDWFNYQTDDGDTALHLAARKGRKKVVELLLQHGAEVDIKNDLGETPLLCAETNNFKDIAKMIREHGAPETKPDPGKTWPAFINNPYSDIVLSAHLSTCDTIPTQVFDSWFISDVFTARRREMPPLTVVQIYDGHSTGFKLGCLLVFDHAGNLLKTIERDRVLVQLLKTDFDFKTDYSEIREKVANHEKIELPDINDDGYAEIPTQRWFDFIGKEPCPEKHAIYLTDNESISCALAIEFYGEAEFHDNKPWPFKDIEYGSLYMKSSAANASSVMVVCQPFTTIKSSDGMITGARRDESRPEQDMGTYTWDSQQRKFNGPTEGPEGLWKVVTDTK